MKYLKITLFTCFTLSTALYFLSCKKGNEYPVIPVQEPADKRSQEAVDARDAAFQKHNAYLDFICSKIASGELNPVKSDASVAQLKSLTKSFFNSGNNGDVNTLIDGAFNNYFTYYSPGQGSQSNYLATDVNTISSAISNYENQTIADFVTQTNSLLNQSDQVLLTQGLASILGVAQGSYTYWFSITSSSCYYANLPQAQGAEERACGEKCKKLAAMALADLSGAADGAAVGATLGGVGAGPGAVMGGAIYSGLMALSW